MAFRFPVLAAFAIAAALLAGCGSTTPAPPPPVADASTERTLPQGRLIGFVDAETGAHVWRSIPFAAPPVDDLRWRAPRAPEGWTGTREAVDPAPWCPQLLSRLDGADAELGKLVGQEDCLYLNVYAPPGAKPGDNKPVMLWIHGGSNTWGRAQQYDGSALAARQDVIVVVVQYRLGPIGWMAHPELIDSAETPEDGSANFGILDQIAALDWVAGSIPVFGGDAENITIFGESAGGHNVAALLAAPLAAGKFQKAIVQSGAFRSVPLSDAIGTTGDQPTPGLKIAASAVPDMTEPTAAALRAAPLANIYAAYDDRQGGQTPPRIIADGVVLPETPLDEAFDDLADFNAVPVILGINRDETKLFNLLNPKLVKQRFGRLPVAIDPDLYDAVSEYQSRMWRLYSVDKPAADMVSAGHAPVYAYRFDWDEAGKVGPSDFAKLFGAAHALEVPFVFGRFRFLGEAEQMGLHRKEPRATARTFRRHDVLLGELCPHRRPGERRRRRPALLASLERSGKSPHPRYAVRWRDPCVA